LPNAAVLKISIQMGAISNERLLGGCFPVSNNHSLLEG